MHMIMGRLVADPEMRSYGENNEKRMAKFRMAVDRSTKVEGQPTADFFNVTAFGKYGEIAEKYFHKGIALLVVGEERNNDYEKKDGSKVYGQELIMEKFSFAESKGSGASTTENAVESDSDGFSPAGDDFEGFPFA